MTVPKSNETKADEITIGGIVRGCGTTGVSVSRADTVADGDFVTAGKTADGR